MKKNFREIFKNKTTYFATRIRNTKYWESLHRRKYVDLILITAAVCGTILFFNNRSREEVIHEQIKNESFVEAPKIQEGEIVKKPDLKEKLNEAITKNNDTVGWVNIPNTDVDFAVLQAPDNKYYLRKNESKQYSFSGCIFADFESVLSPIDKLSDNVILHGHNLDDNPNGARFAQLIKFQDIEFAKNSPYIFLTTRDAELVYQIYAVFFTDIKFQYTRVNVGQEMLDAMIKKAKNKSEYIYDVDVSGKDKIITLSTCTYRYGAYGSQGQKKTRFVIQGKLLGSNDKLKNKVNIDKNPSPEQPDIK